MEENKHEIKTILDILKVVNSNNKENFLKDFSAWLGMNIHLKEQMEGLGLSEEQINLNNFIWIDDGKNDINLTIKIKGGK